MTKKFKEQIKNELKKLLEIETNNPEFYIDRSIESLQKLNDILKNIDSLPEPEKESGKLAIS